jgi:hypothetical protein
MLKRLSRLLVCLLLSITSIAQTNVYPTHWWVGMKDPSLQLMIHQKDIGNGTIRMAPYSGVQLVKTYVPENKN